MSITNLLYRLHYLLSELTQQDGEYIVFKHVAFWILSLLSFSAYSFNVSNISQQELLKANTKNVVIVDVRTPEEFQQGHIPNAINVPLSDIIENPTILKSSQEKPIVLYCRSGYRTGKAAEFLQKEGHQNLRHLEGDMQGWLKAGLPVEK
ncbi:MAG: phage shock protein E [Paraglaciecola sp.]